MYCSWYPGRLFVLLLYTVLQLVYNDLTFRQRIETYHGIGFTLHLRVRMVPYSYALHLSFAIDIFAWTILNPRQRGVPVQSFAFCSRDWSQITLFHTCVHIYSLLYSIGLLYQLCSIVSFLFCFILVFSVYVAPFCPQGPPSLVLQLARAIHKGNFQQLQFHMAQEQKLGTSLMRFFFDTDDILGPVRSWGLKRRSSMTK